MLYYCEIEFVNSQGQVETRSFSRAYSVVFNSDGLNVKASDNVHFLLRDTNRINYLESGTLNSRLNGKDRAELYREVSDLVRDNKRIAAIKAVRDTLGYALRDAKAYVDDNFPHNKPVPISYDEIPF